MGGVSSSRMKETSEGLCFEGIISLANNGGFASVRRSLNPDWLPFQTIRLKVRGDGSRYQVRLRESDDPSALAWRVVFTTTGNWQELELSLHEFEPVFRGQRPDQTHPINPEQIHFLGFMTAEKRPAPFALQIAKIELARFHVEYVAGTGADHSSMP